MNRFIDIIFKNSSGKEIKVTKDLAELSGVIDTDGCNYTPTTFEIDGCIKLCYPLCEICDNIVLDKYNAIAFTPAFSIQNIGGVISFYHGIDNLYSGNDITAPTDMFFDYGDGTVTTYNGIVTPSSILYSNITNHTYTNKNAGEIINIKFGWTSDSGNMVEWSMKIVLPQEGEVAEYAMPYNTGVSDVAFNCDGVESLFVTGNVGVLGTFDDITYEIGINTDLKEYEDFSKLISGITTNPNYLNENNNFMVNIVGVDSNNNPFSLQYKMGFSVQCG